MPAAGGGAERPRVYVSVVVHDDSAVFRRGGDAFVRPYARRTVVCGGGGGAQFAVFRFLPAVCETDSGAYSCVMIFP